MNDSGRTPAIAAPRAGRLRAPRGQLGLWLAAAAVSAWLCALFVGWALGGAVHLLLLVVLWARPWRRG